jgi:hypothetical protein
MAGSGSALHNNGHGGVCMAAPTGATVDRLRGRAEFVEQLVSPNFHGG